jgi:adenylate cyclase
VGTAELKIPAPDESQAPSTAEKLKIRYYLADKSIFIDNDYLIKGVAGAILWRLLQIYLTQGRTDFTNRELRVDPELSLPEIADNLEARLVLLQRRLDDKCSTIKMEKTGRGRFKLVISCTLDIMPVSPV